MLHDTEINKREGKGQGCKNGEEEGEGFFIRQETFSRWRIKKYKNTWHKLYSASVVLPTVLSIYRGFFFTFWFSELEVLKEMRCYSLTNTGLEEK